MSNDKRFRTVTIKMPIAKKDYIAIKKLMDSDLWGATWEVETELSHAPQIGEIWENGWGTRFRITDIDPNEVFPIIGKSDIVEETWTPEGVVCQGMDFSMKNLVERHIPLQTPLNIHPGEDWMMANGLIVKIAEINKKESPTDIYVIHELCGSRTWTETGLYDVNVPTSGYNLKCRVNVTPYEGN